jgi:hypothetical protein
MTLARPWRRKRAFQFGRVTVAETGSIIEFDL